MKYQLLNHTDLNLSSICLGTASFGEYLSQEQAFEILDAYVRQGGNFLDTANIYCRWNSQLGNCSEKIIGEWLKSRNAYKNITVATKGAHYLFGEKRGISRVKEEDIRCDLENSLITLGLEQIDFYWLHRDDESKPIEEIIDIMEKIKNEGKIRYYGLSNYRVERIESATAYLKTKGISGPYGISNQWSMASINAGGNIDSDPTLIEFSEEEFKWHQRTKIAAIPFSSTAFGWFEKMKAAGVRVRDGSCVNCRYEEKLSEEMKKAFWNRDNLLKYEKLLKIQEETGFSLQALSIAYLLQQPLQVFPICGAKNKEQLVGILEATEVPEIFCK